MINADSRVHKKGKNHHHNSSRLNTTFFNVIKMHAFNQVLQKQQRHIALSLSREMPTAKKMFVKGLQEMLKFFKEKKKLSTQKTCNWVHISCKFIWEINQIFLQGFFTNDEK